MLSKIYLVGITVVAVWCALSYAEVLAFNLEPDHTYCTLNLFEIFSR